MRLSRLRRHPLVVVPLVVALLGVGWTQYLQTRDSTSRADAGADLLTDAPPAAWHVAASDDAKATVGRAPGRVSDSAVHVQVTRYGDGDVTLTSPRIVVDAGRSYLFKAYTRNDPEYTLLARYFFRDGGQQLVQLKQHPADAATWSTVAAAFDSGSSIEAVQYVFRLAGTGGLTVDGAYLQADDDVVVPAPPPTGDNLIFNPALTSTDGSAPFPWSTYDTGSNTATFTVGRDDDGPFLQTHLAGYLSGEAKWQYPPIPVQPDRYFAFSATYRSEQPVDVVAEFETDSGRRFENLETVPPAGDWTSISEQVQAPEGARTLLLTLVSHGNGSTDVRGLDLVDVTAPGPARWSVPLISLTVDGGWLSARTEAAPLLAEHADRATFYVTPSTIETDGHLTGADLTALQRAGHEIASAGWDDTDLTTVSDDDLDGSLHRAQTALAQAGLLTRDLATPQGRSDPQVAFYTRRYYSTARGVEPGVNTRQNLDPYDLRIFRVDSRTTPDQLAAAIASAQHSNGWLILVYSQITASDAAGTGDAVSAAAFAQQLDVIDSSGVDVVPVSRAYQLLQPT